MKCAGVSVWDSEGNQTLEPISQSDLEKRPLGKLFIELIEENVWSHEYMVDATFHGNLSFLTIKHPAFHPSNKSLSITNGNMGNDYSVLHVEQLVRTHIRDSLKSIELESMTLQGKELDLKRTLRRIDAEKEAARAK
ncbi:hypothetical protein A2609_03350 [Candidatus Kaiserbacteria bacterium RIFOXYD1_FULL_47_14]|uniref:Uncharacterized protein n=1 Tax=Candidatus Kaiserbacteria bacterium RIFOXYD1_FULL_47_14 TaxID=1798533 RepID=A0A1F6G419_9BACT|nr:MAG: hypothetical protein A2609_03350 [Candidatus Kaiserbacteria bacterium RIFOXYD1_FULL_47_14]